MLLTRKNNHKTPFLPAPVAARLVRSTPAKLRELAAAGCIRCLGLDSAHPDYAVDDLVTLRGGVEITDVELAAACDTHDKRKAQWRAANEKRRVAEPFNAALSGLRSA
jgi:hypothetical protein